MKDLVIKGLALVDATVFMLFGCMIDSDSFVPAIVCLCSGVVLLALVPSIRRMAGE